MRISLFDSPLDQRLSEFKKIPVMPYEIQRLRHDVSCVRIRTNDPVDRLNLHFFFDYRIFPQSIMTYRTEWRLENREMRVGDTVVQQVALPPGRRSLKMVFGVRICEIISETTRRGFVYETLEGHAEKGRSSFTIETGGDGILFKIETFSRPGNAASCLMSPFLTRPYQSYCTRRALENVRNQIENSSVTHPG